jgi:hypothetical protein
MSSRLSVDQVLFPTSANLSDNQNMLDHYDEGSFTPYWSSSGVTAPYESNLFTSASYEAQKGYFVRIGGMVFWQAHILLASSLTYANGGDLSQNAVMVIDDIPHREGNLFDAQNDPANNLRLWGGASVNYINNNTGTGWTGYWIGAYGPTQSDSATANGYPGVIFFNYLNSDGTAQSLLTDHIVEAGNQYLVSGQYVAEVNNFGTK